MLKSCASRPDSRNRCRDPLTRMHSSTKQKFSAFHGRHPAPTHCIVIDDTPLEVACAKPHKAVAVCTGSCTADQLQRTGADLVLETLSEAFDLLTGDIS